MWNDDFDYTAINIIMKAIVYSDKLKIMKHCHKKKVV